MWIELARAFGSAPARGPRQLGAGLDLVRSTGVGYLRQRRREQRARVGRGAVASVYRDIWQRAATQVGASLEDLGEGYCEIRRAGARTRAWLNWLELEDIVTHRLSLDKPLVHELLVALDVPVPEHLEFDFRDLRSAADFLGASELPCVLKPARGTSGGGGVTSGIRTPEELVRARLRASRADTSLLIERQAPGIAHRVLLLDGEIIDAVRRRPPGVVGDGRSSVRELIAAENGARLAAGGWRGFRLLTVDLEAVLTLERQGMTLRSVPPAGARVAVKQVESQNAAHENETVHEPVSPELHEELAAAVAAVGLRLAGVDVVAPDLSRPLRESGGAVVEVNGTPGFQYHYLVAEPERATPVAVPVLERLLEMNALA